MAHETKPLAPEELRRHCNVEDLPFTSTEQLPGLDGVIGQDRALCAVAFGINIHSHGYHMYALGPAGTGKRTMIRKFLTKDAQGKPAPDDWLYVNNFKDSYQPRAIRLPAGTGRQLKEDMDQLVEELKSKVPEAFESKEYQQEQQLLEEDVERETKELLQQLDRHAQARDFKMLQTLQGTVIAPMLDGELVTPERLDHLDEGKRRNIEDRQKELQDAMRETQREMMAVQRKGRERVQDLDRRVVGLAVDHLIDDLKQKYGAYPAVVAFLDEARAFLLKSVQAFKRIKQMEQTPPPQRMAMVMLQEGEETSFEEYRVNLIIDNSEQHGAPVVLESNPTGPNLIGRIEHQGSFGALVTNFRMIRAGALHQANGGYLMLEATDLLVKPLAWQVLKRALKNREIAIENMGEIFGALATRTLKPEPIPLDAKVILMGEPLIYYLLFTLDPEFQELFKVKADFDVQVEWNPETVEQLARFISMICREEGLRHFSAAAVARVVEHSSRIVGNRGKLSAKFGDIVDLIRQANYWASTRDNALVQPDDVSTAIHERIFRSNRIEERLREMIAEGTLLIDTAGAVEGQVNGISVLQLGDYAFGKPSRITARTYMGVEGVVNIEREAKLGGRIHNKGLMILSGYLGGKYAQHTPLSFSATLTFEQLYEEVEGDSAASAELYALLSSLSGYPLRQDLAVTGSVNQRGEIQAIGGVNEKIEGFFEVCRHEGLTGQQGVIIPQANVKHLMLREAVVEAAREGKFHIYAVSTVDEGIALLTGRAAGEQQPDGSYPEGTINAAVQHRLEELAQQMKEFSRLPGTLQSPRPTA